VAAVLPGAPGCLLPKSCTEIGCSDQFVAAVRRADGSFPSGMHRVDVTADGVTLSCTFTFPATAANSGGFVDATCPPGLIVTVGPLQTCTTMTVGNSVVQTCDPVPGQFAEAIAMPGTPAQIHASQYVDGVAILDASAAPSYQDYAPNGKECGPICHQASVDWMLN